MQSRLKIDHLLSVRPLGTYSCMHGTYKRLKPVAVRTCSFAYWLFHAITSERKDLSKIHELKTEKSLRQTHTYLIFSVETTDVADRVVTDRHTHTQTDTQDNYRNPPAHAPRGLKIHPYCANAIAAELTCPQPHIASVTENDSNTKKQKSQRKCSHCRKHGHTKTVRGVITCPQLL